MNRWGNDGSWLWLHVHGMSIDDTGSLIVKIQRPAVFIVQDVNTTGFRPFPTYFDTRFITHVFQRIGGSRCQVPPCSSVSPHILSSTAHRVPGGTVVCGVSIRKELCFIQETEHTNFNERRTDVGAQHLPKFSLCACMSHT